MKKFFELGNRYAAQSDWTDFALTKFCLCAMGVLIGVKIPDNKKRIVKVLSGIVFGLTYFVLMRKVLEIIKDLK